MKQTLLSIGILLCLTHTTVAQTNNEQASRDEDGNCLCEGRGELRKEYTPDWTRLDDLDSLSISYLQDLAGDDFPPNPSCGDVQGIIGNATECPSIAWMSFCCTVEPSVPQCMDTIRTQAMKGYDKVSPPSKSLIHDPVKVSVKMVYHTVTDINEVKGIIEVFVHLTLKWKDYRLAWDYDRSSEGTCTALPVRYRAEMQMGLKDSEIWVPEFDLLNQVTPMSKTMSGQMARVEFDGTVTWFRKGTLRAICQMENLGRIPFEPLGCQLLLGSTKSYRGLGVGYQLDPSGGLHVSPYAGPYNGYKLTDSQPGYISEGTGVFYDLTYQRGTNFYVQNIIVPVAVFSYASLLTMLVGVGAFQTIALNFTLLLTSVTQKIAASRLMPVTNEKLWLTDFVFGSFYFIMFTLAVTFTKFIILQMREERKKPEKEGDTEGPSGDETTGQMGALSKWFFTFSLRKMDVICSCGGLVAYTIYIIVFAASKNNYGGDIEVLRYVNGTDEL